MSDRVAANDGLHRDGKPLTDEQFRLSAEHLWLNAFSCIRPTDEFCADVGRQIVQMLNSSDITTAPIGDLKGSRAVVLWVNQS